MTKARWAVQYTCPRTVYPAVPSICVVMYSCNVGRKRANGAWRREETRGGVASGELIHAKSWLIGRFSVLLVGAPFKLREGRDQCQACQDPQPLSPLQLVTMVHGRTDSSVSRPLESMSYKIDKPTG